MYLSDPIARYTPTTLILYPFEYESLFSLLFYYSFLNMSMNSFVSFFPSVWPKVAYLDGPTTRRKRSDNEKRPGFESTLKTPSLSYHFNNLTHRSYWSMVSTTFSLPLSAFQLSALWRISESNRWPPACKAGALASWANPPTFVLFRCSFHALPFFYTLRLLVPWHAEAFSVGVGLRGLEPRTSTLSV
jgi:hypothetical protein